MNENIKGFDSESEHSGELKQKFEHLFFRLRTFFAAGMILGLQACNKPSPAEPERNSKPNIEAIAVVKTDAEKILDEFPRKLEGSDVEVEQGEKADKVLVVIRQLHLSESISKGKSAATTYWELHTINETQKEIEDVISVLKEKYGVFEVANEGVVENEPLEEFDKALSLMLENIYEDIKENFPDFPLGAYDLKEKFSYLHSAPFKMAEKGEIKVIPAEKEDTFKKISNNMLEELGNFSMDSNGYIERHNVPQNFRDEWDFIFKQRENDVIASAASSPKTTSVVVFGLAHNWKDNVEEWNKSHKEKVGVILITPRTKNESFASRLLINSGFSSEEDSWIEFHFRDFIENFEKTGKNDESLFLVGSTEIKKFQEQNGLTEEQITRAIETIRQATNDQIELRK